LEARIHFLLPAPKQQTIHSQMKRTLAFLALMLVSAGLAVAEEGKPGRRPGGPDGPPPGGPGGPGGDRPKPEDVFKKLDANSDGSIDLTEFKESPRAKEHPDKAEEAFKKIDADGDGKVSLEEFKKHRPPPPGEGRGGKGGKEGRPPRGDKKPPGN
jgi:hypothetical protein